MNYKVKVEPRVQPNKKSYFFTKIDVGEYNDSNIILALRESIHSVFDEIEVDNNYYEFLCETGDSSSLNYYFKPTHRKRLSHVTSVLQKHLPYDFISRRHEGFVDPQTYQDHIKSLKNHNDWVLTHHPNDISNELMYEGKDLEVFEDHSNFFPWQKKVYDMIFEEGTDKMKQPKHRKIITIVNTSGDKGKSSFQKYLCYKNPHFITKIGFGLSGQLRSAVISQGIKMCYLIDIPRTRSSSDKMEDIMSIIEESSNGFLTSPFYGRASILMMEPPFIFVFSNAPLPYEMLSLDRWECYTITDSSKPDLKKVSVKSFQVKKTVRNRK